MTKIQKSASFILPKLSLDYNQLTQNGFQSSYLGVDSWEEDQIGSMLLLAFDKNKLSEDFIEVLKQHRYYDDIEYLDSTTAVVYFDLPQDFVDSVVKPFLEGKYSEIDRRYVNTYFPEYTYGGTGNPPKKSMNWRILSKDPKLREYWEDLLDVSLPEDAEVWSKPELDEEILKTKIKEDVEAA